MKILRTRVSVSLPRDLVGRIERAARSSRRSRSRVVEDWLRLGARQSNRAALDDEIEAYYATRPSDERGDDDAIAAASSRAARRLRFDDGR